MDVKLIVLAFFAGILGTIMGGTQTFIGTGFFGLILAGLTLSGMSSGPVIDFLNQIILNDLFCPCVIFLGAVGATAYAAKHYDIRGVDTNRSLLFTKDIKVFLCGGLFSTCGFLMMTLFNELKVPADVGALTIIIFSTLIRLLFNQEQWINTKPLTPSLTATLNLVLFQCILALATSALTIFLVDLTKITSITFYISALSLIFSLKYPSFPATHHISMVTGYMFVQTHDIILSMVFGLIAQLLLTIFTKYFNRDCGTHIDPPAVVIASLSFIIFTMF